MPVFHQSGLVTEHYIDVGTQLGGWTMGVGVYTTPNSFYLYELDLRNYKNIIAIYFEAGIIVTAGVTGNMRLRNGTDGVNVVTISSTETGTLTATNYYLIVRSGNLLGVAGMVTDGARRYYWEGMASAANGFTGGARLIIVQRA